MDGKQLRTEGSWWNPEMIPFPPTGADITDTLEKHWKVTILKL